MAIIDSAAMLARARADVGRARIPQGQCLNWVWTKAGARQSIPPALGRMDTAQHAWEAVEEADRIHGDPNPIAGVTVFFGPSPTRTDGNKDAGDVAISLGGGMLAATDAAGAYIGLISIPARAKQTQRPYLGSSKTLGGHRFSATISPVTVSQIITAAAAEGLNLMASRVIPIKKADGFVKTFLANPDTFEAVEIDATAAAFYKNSGIPTTSDPQPYTVLAGFLNVVTGGRISG